KTGLNDAIKVGYGKLEGAAVVIAVQDFDFMGGSLGMAAGEAIIRGMELAVEKKAPFIVFAASGGARMQEGILSLMQLPRTTVARLCRLLMKSPAAEAASKPAPARDVEAQVVTGPDAMPAAPPA